MMLVMFFRGKCQNFAYFWHLSSFYFFIVPIDLLDAFVRMAYFWHHIPVYLHRAYEVVSDQPDGRAWLRYGAWFRKQSIAR